MKDFAKDSGYIHKRKDGTLYCAFGTIVDWTKVFDFNI